MQIVFISIQGCFKKKEEENKKNILYLSLRVMACLIARPELKTALKGENMSKNHFKILS